MKKKTTLLSFVGTNDAGKLRGKEDGAILTTLKEMKFDTVCLLWNKGNSEINYEEIVRYLSEEIINRKRAKEVKCIQFNLNDVTDHNQIYQELKSFCNTLPKLKDIEYTAAISSGTPSMQVCWILLSESGDFSEEFPLKLIRIRDPKFGLPSIIPVKLDTTLPKIVSLKNEIENLKKHLIPELRLDIKKGKITVGNNIIPLSPIEFSYYRYFSERAKTNKDLAKFSGIFASKEFLSSIIKYHEESFPDLDLLRDDLVKMIRKGDLLTLTTFRGNVSKVNKKLKTALGNETLYLSFCISVEGQRGAKFYGIKCSSEKIIIT